MSMEANKMETKILDELYQKIATQVIETIPEEWDKFKLYSEVDKYSDTTMFYYYPKNSKEPIYSLDIEDIDGVDEDIVQNNLSKLSNLLRNLWEEFIRNEHEPWTNLTFEIDAEGDFTIDYDYTNLDAVKYDHFERIIIWKYEHLGILPKSGRDDELSMVEAYIANKNK
ncbi:antitoxin YezG family protein [Listeria booriae]|uniref:antitoxin YezG family protein n=1 Tax=Listeria booriae TaxID=1552123 RepID=UPI0021AD8F2D|nr:antitoxin YezG family protein [Listeria booriae]